VPHVRIWPGGDGQPSSLPGPFFQTRSEIAAGAVSSSLLKANMQYRIPNRWTPKPNRTPE
jgi:hypothetical protein